MGELEQLLKNAGNEYEDTPDEEDLPSGPSFMLQLQSAELAVSSKGGAIVKRAHLIIDGEHEGCIVRDNLHPLNGGFCTRRFKDWCRVMGYDPPESKIDIEETVAAIAGDDPIYMASITKAGGFVNIVCTKLLEKEDHPGGAAPKSGGTKKTKVAANDDAAEPEPEEPAEIAKGDTVTFTDEDGDEATGTITKLKNGKADIDTPSTDYESVPVEKLTLVGDEPEEPPTSVDDELVDLIALAQANDIGVDDNTERDDLVKLLKTHKWDKDQLADDEVALLEGVGVKFKTKVQPKPKAKQKAGAKKPKKTAKRR